MRTVLKGIAATVGVLAVGVLLLYWTVLRSSYYQPYYEVRSKVGAHWRTNGFHIAVVWPHHSDLSFVEGVRTAVEEVDRSNSPLAGKMRVKYYEEPSDSSGRMAASIAEKIVADPSVVAVMGHELSASAIPASLVYESHGVLFLTPKSSDPRLTTHDFLYTFRLTPTDSEIASAMVKFANGRGWKRIGVLYSRSPTGESLSPQILAAAAKQGLTTVFARSYLAREADWQDQDFRLLIADVIRQPFDAVMIADALPRGAKLVMDLRKMGVKLPIIGGDDLDSKSLWQIAHEAANDVYVASAVNPSATTARFLEFKQRFHSRWGVDPGYGASQGYESVMLLVEAGRESNTADPLVVATTLRSYEWHGLFGEYRFTKAGDIEGRSITVKRLFNGEFTAAPL